MQVILLEDVQGLGKAGEVVNASTGHAKNFLLPRGLASLASKANINRLEHTRAHVAAKNAQALADAEEFAKKIAEVIVKIPVRSGDAGRIYGSITNKEVAEALSSQHGISLDRKKIVMQPAKTIGMHSVEVKLHKDVDCKLNFELTKA